jgi:hypothetical protein
LKVEGGRDADIISLTDTFAQNVKISLGDGVNELTIDGLARSAGLLRSNLDVTSGNGVDTVTLSDVTAGNLNLRLGDGANTLTADTIDALRVRYEGGSGVDDVTITNSTFLEVFGRFGNGDDLVDLDTVTITDRVDIDGGAGTDSLTQNTVTLPPSPSRIKVVSF